MALLSARPLFLLRSWRTDAALSGRVLPGADPPDAALSGRVSPFSSRVFMHRPRTGLPPYYEQARPPARQREKGDAQRPRLPRFPSVEKDLRTKQRRTRCRRCHSKVRLVRHFELGRTDRGASPSPGRRPAKPGKPRQPVPSTGSPLSGGAAAGPKNGRIPE